MGVKPRLFGHSLTYCLSDFISRKYHNLDLHVNNIQVVAEGIRGGRLGWNTSCNSRFQKMPIWHYLSDAVQKSSPDIVFLQIGGNDLDNNFVAVGKLVNDIISMADYIIANCSVKVVLIGHAFPRLSPYNISMEQYKQHMHTFKNCLLEKTTHNKQIIAVPNAGFTKDITHVYREDGVHLNDIGNEVFAKNVRRKLIFAAKYSRNVS